MMPLETPSCGRRMLRMPAHARRGAAPEVQAKMFALLDLSSETVDERFGFFVEALGFGTPLHAAMVGLTLTRRGEGAHR